MENPKQENRTGCNYDISFREVMESEKKIRVKRILSLVSKNKINLKEVIIDLNADNDPECDDQILNSDVDLFKHILSLNYLDVCEIDSGSFIYVCGYASSSQVKKLNNFELCISAIRDSKGDNIDNQYFDSLERGGLSITTNEVICVMFNLYAIFYYIVNNSNLEASFLKLSNQKQLLIKLAMLSLNANGFFDENVLICLFGNSIKTLYAQMYKSFCNILLNNFTKHKNDNFQNVQNLKKKRKLQTLLNYVTRYLLYS
jgi:hypothetical protein